MSTTATGQKVTWAEWLGPNAKIDPEQLMTRSEFLEALNREGLGVTASALAYWETQGILPRGMHGRHTNARQSLYPPVAVPIVQALRQMQDAGVPLAHIKHSIRGWPEQLAYLPPEDWRPEVLKELVTVSGDPTVIPEYANDLRAAVGAVGKLMQTHNRITGIPVAYAELRIIPISGRAVEINLTPHNDPAGDQN